MESLGWRQRRASSPRASARPFGLRGLTVSASNTLMRGRSLRPKFNRNTLTVITVSTAILGQSADRARDDGYAAQVAEPFVAAAGPGFEGALSSPFRTCREQISQFDKTNPIWMGGLSPVAEPPSCVPWLASEAARVRLPLGFIFSRCHGLRPGGAPPSLPFTTLARGVGPPQRSARRCRAAREQP